MAFYQIDITTTALGGKPYTKSGFFRVWDNANIYRDAAIESAEKRGFRLLEEKHENGVLTNTYISDTTAMTIEITVYDRKFDD